MKHFLAYGNSDQQSFRDQSVRDSFDTITIPSTIASYYPDATAAFVLSCDKPYIIDPRTPLFQNELRSPRASHLTLAEWGGPTLRARLDEGPYPSFPTSFYSESTVREFVGGFISMQRNYALRRGEVGQKLDRYRRLLATALDKEPEKVGELSSPPELVLSPYFVVRTLDDPWWDVQNRVWAACEELEATNKITPVLAISSAHALRKGLDSLPDSLSRTTFFWIPGFDERLAEAQVLDDVWNGVRESSTVISLVNLYGGYFSICMEHVGLYGFSNGLAYSESRAFPDLAATGAAPARYYVNALHAFTSLADAQQIVDMDDWFVCPCEVCSAARVSKRLIQNLTYHELKKHFAISRRREIAYVSEHTREEIVEQLKESHARSAQVLERLPARFKILRRHLLLWARTIENDGQS